MIRFVAAFLRLAGPLVAVAAFLTPAYSRQPEPTFRRLSLEDGLSQASVYCIHQDRTGYIWFGTADGLNRYDGYGFTVYRHAAGDTSSLSDNTITALCEDSLGTLWIGTMAGGVNSYAPGSGRFHRLVHGMTAAPGLGDGRIRALCTDPFGRVWVGTQQGGLYAIDPTGERAVTSELPGDPLHAPQGHAVRAILPDAEGLWIGTDGAGILRVSWNAVDGRTPRFVDPRISSLAPGRILRVEELLLDHSGHLWVGTIDEGVYRLTLRNESIAAVQRFVSRAGDPSTVTGDVVQAFCEDASGSVWIGTWEGLNILEQKPGHPDGWTVCRVLHDPQKPGSLSANVVHAIAVDRSGVMWVGTRGGGVSYRDTAPPKFQLYVHDPFNPQGFPPGQVRAIVSDPTGFWVGTTGGGIALIADSADEVIALRHDPGSLASLSSDDIRTLWIDRSGVLWAGTYGGGLNRIERAPGSRHRFNVLRFHTGAPGDMEVFAFLEDRRGRFWVGTQNGIVRFEHIGASGRSPLSLRHFRHDSGDSSRISHRIVRMLFEDSRGIIWAGTYGGLNRIDPGSDRVSVYRPDSSRKGSISHSVVVAACEDAAGVLWFGTFGGGLNRFDPHTGTFQALDERDGLPNAYVYGILADAQGNLWISSNRGLARFNANRWHPGMPRDSCAGLFRVFTMMDGLQSNEYNAGSVHANASGELFFGGINGLNRFLPAEVRDASYEPSVVVTGFQIFDRKIDLDSACSAEGVLHLTYEQNHFSLEAASLDFAHPASNRYAFMLDGFDTRWREAGTRRYAAYTNIGHGEYTLRVRARNGEGIWSGREAALRLTISPPFWHTWWFRSAIAALLAAVVVTRTAMRRRALRNERTTRQRFLQQLIESQERERKRIAGELHDSLGQNLLLIKNRALLGLGNADTVHTQLQEISALASQTIGEVREISYALRPYQLDRLGITKAIRAACRQVRESTRLDLSVNLDTIDGLLPKELEITMYRIVQEGLSNVVRHAHASSAQVTVHTVDQTVTLEISDNGKGFTQESGDGARGFGISGIRERARILGGTAEIRSAPGSGTHIVVRVPVP